MLLSLLLLAGCGEQPHADETPRLELADSHETLTLAGALSPYAAGLHSWSELEKSLCLSLEYLALMPQQEIAVESGHTGITWSQLRASAAELLGLLPLLDHTPTLLAERFEWLAVRPRTLLTGYYEPWIEVSTEQSEEYPYPLYGTPQDLKTVDLGIFSDKFKGERITYRVEDGEVRPYYARNEIDFEGALQGKGAAVAWAKDIVDIFVLQIQGSGRLVYPDGSVRHILYSGQNGHKYVSLGRVLIDRGLMQKEGMSMQRIREFLKDNKELLPELLSCNPSYVFFKIDDSGPYGAMGRIITPMASVAVDRKLVPLGAVMFMDTTLPRPNGSEERFQSLVLAQDTGGAIKGTRCDLFCGSGEQAEFLAGHLKNEARMYVLVSKTALRSWEYRAAISQ